MSECPVCELHAESIFKIEGMDCHEEVAILEHRLKTLTGLESLDADVVGQRLRIQYDAAKLTTSRIAEAVAQTGMRAWLEHEEPRPAKASLWRQRLVFLSGLCLAGGLTLQLSGSAPLVWLIPYAAAIGTRRHADGTTRVDVADGGPARHPRTDDGGGCRRAGAGRLGRRRVGRVPVRACAGSRVASDGAGTWCHPRTDGPGAS